MNPLPFFSKFTRKNRTFFRSIIKITASILLLLLLAGCTMEPSAPEFTAPSPAAIRQETSTPTPEPTPTPDPEPDALTAAEGVYTIGWFTDTQHYSAKFPQTFYAMTDFLAKEQARMNLQYLVFTGDFVHNYDSPEQWEIADDAMQTIDSIPHGVLAGNHDYNSKSWTYNEYSAVFGAARYTEKPWYGGSYEDNRCHYDLITLGDTDYLFLYLSYAPDSGCIRWANEILAQYPERVGILCVHDYFTTETDRSEDGETLFHKIVQQNANLYMVLCGHRYTVYAEDTPLDDDGDGVPDRTVHQAMANYQAAGDEGGSGYMRFLQVDESAGTISMYTYSPVTDDYTYFDTPEHLAEKYPSDAKYEEYKIPIPWMSTQE